jgi:hypothetical protein
MFGNPWFGNEANVLIADVFLSAGAVAELALRLSRAGHAGLAQRLGIAFDRDVGRLALFPGDGEKILSVIDDATVDGLPDLRKTLIDQRQQTG